MANIEIRFLCILNWFFITCLGIAVLNDRVFMREYVIKSDLDKITLYFEFDLDPLADIIFLFDTPSFYWWLEELVSIDFCISKFCHLDIYRRPTLRWDIFESLWSKVFPILLPVILAQHIVLNFFLTFCLLRSCIFLIKIGQHVLDEWPLTYLKFAWS